MNISAEIPKEPPTQKGCPTPELVPNTYWDAQLTENQNEVPLQMPGIHKAAWQRRAAASILFSPGKSDMKDYMTVNSKDRALRELHLGIQMWITGRRYSNHKTFQMTCLIQGKTI